MGVPGTTAGGGAPAVLEDPTGKRARWLRRAGRGVFVLFLAWLLAIVLGGLGLIPVAGIPLVHVLRPSQGPPPVAKPPQPRPPSASDLRPAVPAKVFAATVAGAGRQTPPTVTGSHGRSSSAPGQTKTSPSAGTAHGRSSTAPGHTKTSPSAGTAHGRSSTAPGHTKTTSTTAPPNKKP